LRTALQLPLGEIPEGVERALPPSRTSLLTKAGCTARGTRHNRGSGVSTVATQNNVHIPEELLNKLTAAAEAQGTTADELLAAAAHRFLEHKQLDELAARGRMYAERAGNPDPVKAVRDVRRA
jgi:hypothetical protein